MSRRNPRDRRETPKPLWQAIDFRQNLSEAVSMLELARQYPHALDADKWAAEVYRRTGELEAFEAAHGGPQEAAGAGEGRLWWVEEEKTRPEPPNGRETAFQQPATPLERQN